MSLPLLLAGPILRRVQPDSASVWIAFSKPQSLSLYIWEDTTLKSIPGGQSGVFKPKESDRAFKQENISTKTFGENLHIAVVTVKAAFLPGKIYSYNLVFKSGSTEQDLNTIGLLKDCGGKRVGNKDEVPLGFEKGQLPSFVLPNTGLEELIIAHGSCRTLHAKGNDALALLDEVVKANLSDPKKRLQQLFLTGDQIYADEQAFEVLYFLNQTATDLAGKVENLRVMVPDGVEPIEEDNDDSQVKDAENPLKPPPPPKDAPCNFDFFPPGLRGNILNRAAGYTSTSGENHLLSFAEFGAGYLYALSPFAWHDTLIEQLKKLVAEDLVEDFSFVNLEKTKPFIYESIVKKHILEKIDGFNQEMDSLALTPKTSGKLPARGGALDSINQEDRKKWISTLTQNRETETRRVYDFLRTLPYVSRVLANVPVFMIFDDHDVTDDWNFNLRWCNRVYMRPLGVDVTRNALMAYTVFQDWGNVPAAYAEANSTKARLLDLVSQATQEIATDHRASDTTNETLHSLFGFGIRDPENPNPNNLKDQRVRWHYRIKTGPADTFFLDTRTRRYFPHLNAFPQLIPEKVLDEQIPDPDPDKLAPLTFVISAVPAQSPSVLEEQGQPILAGVEVLAKGNSVAGEAPGIVSTRLQRDLEGWAFNPAGHDAFLQKLAKFKHVALLSGDVHFGFSTVTDYWDKNNTNKPSRIIQLTSSALKNPWGRELRIFLSGFTERLLSGFEGKIEKHVWRGKAVEVKVNGDIPPLNLARLHRQPVILAAHGWPAGSTVTPAPEARWRMVVQADEREQAGDELFRFIKDPVNNAVIERDLTREYPNLPDVVPPEGLELLQEAKSPEENLEVYRALASRHQNRLAKGLARQLVWHTNVAVIDFEKKGTNSFVLHHRFRYSLRVGDKPAIPAEAAPLDDKSQIETNFFTEHHIPLEAVTETEKTPPKNLGESNGSEN